MIREFSVLYVGQIELENVLATVVGAFNREYRITVVGDAVATLWPEIQHATLDIIRRAYGRVASAKELADVVSAW